MNNIKTADDVRQWAKMIVDAKGDKYTPLAKADMLAIAQFIVDMGGDAPAEPDNPPTETAVGTADNKPSEKDESKPTTAHTSSTTADKQTSTATMMRSYALHRAGFTVQQAYDKFLKWSKEHPKEASVMDFSTGTRSANAAFAYWLAEIISVEVPTTARF